MDSCFCSICRVSRRNGWRSLSSFCRAASGCSLCVFGRSVTTLGLGLFPRLGRTLLSLLLRWPSPLFLLKSLATLNFLTWSTSPQGHSKQETQSWDTDLWLYLKYTISPSLTTADIDGIAWNLPQQNPQHRHCGSPPVHSDTNFAIPMPSRLLWWSARRKLFGWLPGVFRTWQMRKGNSCRAYTEMWGNLQIFGWGSVCPYRVFWSAKASNFV